MKRSPIDKLRDIPEVAVRLIMGAEVSPGNGTPVISLDGRAQPVTLETLSEAESIAKLLTLRPLKVETVSDVLELRHKAEETYLEKILGVSELPQVLFVPAGDMASAYYRAMIPADIMQDSGAAISHFTRNLDLSKALRYQILWVQLAASPILRKIVAEAKRQGVKIVYDLDDRFDVIPEENPAAEIYVEEKQSDVWEMIRLADVVTVSTDPIREYVLSRIPVKDVRVLPNMVTAAVAPQHRNRQDGIFRILWAGSPTHQRDLRIITPALRRILRRHNGKVRFVCFGDRPPEDLLECSKHVDLEKFVEFEEYLEKLADIGAQLAVAPLEANEFNGAKSAIKFLEYSSVRYASLYSPVGEYTKVHRDGAPIRLVADDAWEGELVSAIRTQSRKSAWSNVAYDWVRRNRCIMKTKAKPWLEVARELAGNRKEALA